MTDTNIISKIEFQSTRPVWGATLMPVTCCRRLSISIHAPRVGRDFATPLIDVPILISIHAPRVGRDTLAIFFTALLDKISIHAPRVGRDDYQKHRKL